MLDDIELTGALKGLGAKVGSIRTSGVVFVWGSIGLT